VSKHFLDWIVQCRIQNISIYMRTLLPIDHRRRHRVVITVHSMILEIKAFLLTNCIINVDIMWLDIVQDTVKRLRIHQIKYDFTEFGADLTTVLPVLFKYCCRYCYSDSRKLWAVMQGGGLALYNLIQPTISLEMPVPSQGHYGFHGFPVVDWFCLFIYLWVLTFPL